MTIVSDPGTALRPRLFVVFKHKPIDRLEAAVFGKLPRNEFILELYLIVPGIAGIEAVLLENPPVRLPSVNILPLLVADRYVDVIQC